MNRSASMMGLAILLLVAGCATGFQTSSGSVIGSNGTPIAGATVCARPKWHLYPLSIHVACAASDDAGRYRIDGYDGMPYTVYASAPQHKPKRVEPINPHEVKPRSTIDFALAKGGALVRGRVLDRGGAPIAGALVSAVPDCGEGAGPFAQSNERGDYEVWLDEGPVMMNADAGGHVPAVETGLAPSTINLVLTPESKISGRVVDRQTRKPIAAATVSIKAARGICYSWSELATISDDEGRFTIGQLPEGRFSPSVSSGGWNGSARTPISVGFVDRIDDVVVEVDRTHRVSGRLLGPDGESCSKGSVELDPNKDEAFDELHARVLDGAFTFDSVPTHDYELHGWCNGQGNKAVRIVGDVSDLVLETVATTEAVAILKGRVVDHTGAPVSAAYVVLQRAGMIVARQPTEPDGAFMFSVPWSGRAEVGLSHDFIRITGPIGSCALEIDREAEPVTLVVPRPGQVRGRVVMASGAPVARARLDLAYNLYTLTNAEGEFQIDVAPPGRYRLEVSIGQLQLNSEPSSIEVISGATAETKIVVENVGGRIAGSIVDESGSPVPDASVRFARDHESRPAWQLWGRSDATMTASDGEFELEGLTEDTFTVVAKRAGLGAGHASGIKAGQRTTIVLHPLGSITGRVEVRGGSVPDEFRIELGGDAAPIGTSRFLSFDHARGHFQIDDLVAGEYTLTVESASGVGRAEARVESGKKTDVVVRIEGHTTIRGRLIDIDTGQPAASVPVSVADTATLRRWRTSTSKADGTFEIDEVPATKVEILAPAPWGESAGYVEMMRGVVLELQPHATNDVDPIYVRRNPLREGEQRGYFGLHIEPRGSGVFIRAVQPGSPPAQAGLIAGDEITHVDGADVTGTNGYQFWLRAFPKLGQEMEFRLRDGRVLRLTARLP